MESVDDYDQDLQSLFHKAYTSVQGESEEAEAMGQSVLSYQFVAGLRDELKAKLVGCTGIFEELLGKARFEEARLRDVVTPKPNKDGPPSTSNKRSLNGPLSTNTNRNKNNTTNTLVSYHCRGSGHIARDCPLRGRGLPVESQGGRSKNNTQRN